MSFSPDGNYVTTGENSNCRLTLLDHTTPGSVSLAATYITSTGVVSAKFSKDGSYIMVGQNDSFTHVLLDHTTPGSLSVAAAYTMTSTDTGSSFGPAIFGLDFSSDDQYIAVGYANGFRFMLLDHTTPGSISIATTYTMPSTVISVAFSPN